jgi:hypothetical protein
MFVGGLLGVRNDGQDAEDGLEITLATRPVCAGGSFYTVPQLSDRNRRNLESLVRERPHPRLKVKRALFTSDDNVTANLIALTPSARSPGFGDTLSPNGWLWAILAHTGRMLGAICSRNLHSPPAAGRPAGRQEFLSIHVASRSFAV